MKEKIADIVFKVLFVVLRPVYWILHKWGKF
jgi:hypothetical protein